MRELLRSALPIRLASMGPHELRQAGGSLITGAKVAHSSPVPTQIRGELS